MIELGVVIELQLVVLFFHEPGGLLLLSMSPVELGQAVLPVTRMGGVSHQGPVIVFALKRSSLVVGLVDCGVARCELSLRSVAYSTILVDRPRGMLAVVRVSRVVYRNVSRQLGGLLGQRDVVGHSGIVPALESLLLRCR